VRTPTHETVLDCLEAGIEAAHPSVVVPEQVHYDARTERLTVADGSYDLSAVENVYVIGGGNATGAIALALESALGDRIDGEFGRLGVVCDQRHCVVGPSTHRIAQRIDIGLSDAVGRQFVGVEDSTRAVALRVVGQLRTESPVGQ